MATSWASPSATILAIRAEGPKTKESLLPVARSNSGVSSSNDVLMAVVASTLISDVMLSLPVAVNYTLIPGHLAIPRPGFPMQSSDFDAMTAMELRGRIARREVSPVEATRRALEKAAATQGSLNAFFFLMPEQALAAAKTAEDSVVRGDRLGLLHGVPFSAKDLIAVGGERFAFGSRCMADNIAAADAPPVERAKRAGGILIGKTTTSEFGCKAVGDSPLTGITRNPWNLQKTPGGS